MASDDLIADAIGLLRPRTAVEPMLHAGGVWAVRFDSFPHVKLGVVVRGGCWLSLDGHDPVRLEAGDFYLLGNPPRYLLASDLSADQTEADSLWKRATDGVVALGATASDTSICGGRFTFDDTDTGFLIEMLPTLVHIRAGDPRGLLLAHLSELMVAELENPTTGSGLILDHLAQILFVHMLRAHADLGQRPAGWLGALRDDGIGAALRAMHADVGYRWTLTELATIGRMSRSTFASTFKKQVGKSPVDYLIHWRMSLARDALRRGSRSISDITFATGYESESAFSTAFRRVVGASPKQYRNSLRQSLTITASAPRPN